MAADPPQQPRSVWRYVRASRAHVVIDAAAYFAVMQAQVQEDLMQS